MRLLAGSRPASEGETEEDEKYSLQNMKEIAKPSMIFFSSVIINFCFMSSAGIKPYFSIKYGMAE
jgi:energy-converting hydrogenase Eha subunit H